MSLKTYFAGYLISVASGRNEAFPYLVSDFNGQCNRGMSSCLCQPHSQIRVRYGDGYRYFHRTKFSRQ